MSQEPVVLGWDIGGVNTKAARLPTNRDAPDRSLSLPYELQRDRSRLTPALQEMAAELGDDGAAHHAVTMTAELSQAFRTKREGVGFIVSALETAFPAGRIHVYTVTGAFVTPHQARSQPLDVAASNWAATARWIAQKIPNCILIDIGTTTTDLIPIHRGVVAAHGFTDPARLASGELIYSGALRTPVEAFARSVPLNGGTAALSAEGFALSGDVHLWLDHLDQQDYTCSTPDGRPATREFAGDRLARVVCADREMLDDRAIDAIAGALARAQLQPIVAALGELRTRFPDIRTAAVTGLGEFMAREAAGLAGLQVVPLGNRMEGKDQTAAAAAVACLLRQAHPWR